MKDLILNTVLTDREIGFFYLGQEGYILKSGKTAILIDGFLTGPLAAPGLLWGRNYAAPIQPEELDFIDYVVCSHDHSDHTDPNTLRGILSVNDHAKFVMPAAYAMKTVTEYGVPADRLIPAHEGDVLTLGDFTVTPLASAHEELHMDENGDYFEMGYLLKTIGVTIYHSGDCCIYDGLKEKVGKVDIAMLPVNGRSYYKLKNNIIGNMTLEEACIFASEAEAKLFIPMHFDLFRTNCIPAAWIPDAVEQYAAGMHYEIFTPGERYIYMK